MSYVILGKRMHHSSIRGLRVQSQVLVSMAYKILSKDREIFLISKYLSNIHFQVFMVSFLPLKGVTSPGNDTLKYQGGDRYRILHTINPTKGTSTHLK